MKKKREKLKEGSLPDPANIDTFSPAQLGGATLPLATKCLQKAVQEHEHAGMWAGSKNPTGVYFGGEVQLIAGPPHGM